MKWENARESVKAAVRIVSAHANVAVDMSECAVIAHAVIAHAVIAHAVLATVGGLNRNGNVDGNVSGGCDYDVHGVRVRRVQIVSLQTRTRFLL